jgi:hypothetical protein
MEPGHAGGRSCVEPLPPPTAGWTEPIGLPGCRWFLAPEPMMRGRAKGRTRDPGCKFKGTTTAVSADGHLGCRPPCP